MRRTTTPVKRPHDGGGSHDETDWRHEETVTVRRVRQVPASAAQQHFGDATVAAGPGVRTGERQDAKCHGRSCHMGPYSNCDIPRPGDVPDAAA